METLTELATALGVWPGAQWLRASWVAYLVVNAVHIIGIALLVGPIVILDLRLMGAWRHLPLSALAPLLSHVAAFGLGLAVLAGAWLFTVRPAEYLANPAFGWKLALIALALANIAVQHANPAYRRALATDLASAGVKLSAAASALLWVGVVIAGRWIGFA
ncbi:DUF6644 family protein [Ancylobacter amanitiformis]|uniref:DUF6644 domain-containing protein n=1 Tax=Ancylobacter amanitiformis TaxID=217069 RepID=A0ABU0LSJ0_9HYPH|nr:DUF6644 family protein [Ancylobacter amanitiformis]MDQ0511675.1 hypothetical protein [Ancylobacter amanitiformis]